MWKDQLREIDNEASGQNRGGIGLCFGKDPYSRVWAGEGEKTHVILAKNVNRFIPSPLKKECVSQVT